MSVTAPSAPAVPEYLDLAQGDPDETSAAGSATWYVRGQNFALAYTTLVAGDVLQRTDQPDEYVLILPGDDGDVEVRTNEESEVVTRRAVVMIPPGTSSVVARADCHVVRLLTCRSQDVLDLARNAESYREAHPYVAPFAAWPEPPEGYRIRAYRMADLEVTQDPTRPGQLLRCSTFMVNVLAPRIGPRDPDSLSPHHHDDFEQCSLAVEGEYEHHLRTPWGKRLSEWREDEHVVCGSPSVAVIPPPLVHTSQAIGPGSNRLIDVFCPPRVDFSLMPGRVLNETTYPMPDQG
ncbi:hypothetical protein FB381_3329 [Nocardioides albertanoniae]|uniref:5-deoxy-glucuronate isomerase n=1 Tax=Nocardioides albertanoniae TaxID=1175486 RepID=A0A543A9Z2_9ACTN|nr:hypothetical protein [Nocardioides albertanoniae]TQL69424.1 hypothetical protein FB381_3329 [Nocardioides albertanoniae]